MNLSAQLARHLREVHFGGNWTDACLKAHLTDVHWQQATQTVASCNSIAVLVYHINYYLNAVFNVVKGNPLNAKHSLSFECPHIQSEADWQALLDKTWKDAEDFAQQIETWSDEQLWSSFSEKYGTFYRNIQGVIEHTHYHAGQIILIKKWLM